MLKWYDSPSLIKIHLSDTHHITESIAASYLEVLQKGDHNLISNIIKEENSNATFEYCKDKDFIKMINGFDLYYKVPYSKTLKDQISLAK
ncbi:12649_t:CDS:2 [Funneliformis geosporum]|uniref:8867_t:CDS:1 n=1 Tax=Funneliformis geosporum TaxID=1117311 RepID=A0A9W4SR49_9GLOM|nr:12649_t:CDS:2 [Funneliformis geosporum]CAI2177882.1 8867_t:CDS:2 [Funneliformis geosporum]